MKEYFSLKALEDFLGKVVLFQSRVPGYPQNDVTLNLFPDSKRPLQGLLNNMSFVPDFLCEGNEKAT